MNKLASNHRIEYGDFQTPPELAHQICKKLNSLGIRPDVLIEPTCGIGAFVQAAVDTFPTLQHVIAVETSRFYLDKLQEQIHRIPDRTTVELFNADFFQFDWASLFKRLNGNILMIGNFPWVTNSQQGMIAGENLPQKQNFRDFSGLDALTGKSNFDISEWMLVHVAQYLQPCKGQLAMLCKSSVARKFLNHCNEHKIGLSSATIYGIDAAKHFAVAVDACLLVCHFDMQSQNHDYNVYPSINSDIHRQVGHRNGLTIRDLESFARHQNLLGDSGPKWRSGVKHDCSQILELKKSHDCFINGLGEEVDIEPDFLYPLLKGSDVANGRTAETNRYLVLPQKAVGESTVIIKQLAPKTWSYLETHAAYLDNRKSRIYENNPRYSVFGVGSYTFAPWKIAICSLYKTLSFRVIGKIQAKPVVFDDTVYFISFETQTDALSTLEFLNSQPVIELLSSMIFWDEKRPIKTGVLNRLKLLQKEQPRNLSLFPTDLLFND